MGMAQRLHQKPPAQLELMARYQSKPSTMFDRDKLISKHGPISLFRIGTIDGDRFTVETRHPDGQTNTVGPLTLRAAITEVAATAKELKAQCSQSLN
jgi:hypothetical protein